MGYGRRFMLNWLTCPSRPIFTGLCSFHGLERCAVFVKGNSRLQVERKTSIAHNFKQLHKKKKKKSWNCFFMVFTCKSSQSWRLLQASWRSCLRVEPSVWENLHDEIQTRAEQNLKHKHTSLMCTNIKPHKTSLRFQIIVTLKQI